MGADFEVIDDRELDETHQPFWEKLRMRSYLEQYSRVLFMDSDIIVHPDAPSLFDVVPPDCLGMTCESHLQSTSDKAWELRSFCTRTGIQMPRWDGRYWNVGAICFSQEHRPIFDDPPCKISCDYPEQDWINVQIARLRPKMFCLPRSLHDWAYLIKQEERIHELAGLKRYIVHFAGQKKDANLVSDIKEYLAKWSRT
jgi:lipopolysaccharide biosynthesis glycosyltransferase